MAADIPAELREAAGRVAHDAYRAAHTSPTGGAIGEAGASYLHAPGVEHMPISGPPCASCDGRMRAWPDLSEAARENFRAQGDPALSAVWPVLVECKAVVVDLPGNRVCSCYDAGGPCARCAVTYDEASALRARLAALGIRP